MVTRRKARRNYLQSKGVRSGLEDRMQEYLDDKGVKYQYEEILLEYYLKERGICMDCESHNIHSKHTYKPDFYLPDYGYYIETKGRFLGKDRTKHRAVMEYHPDADIRFVFYRDDWMTGGKKKRYSDWCISKDIPYFVRVPKTTKREEILLPDEWL